MCHGELATAAAFMPLYPGHFQSEQSTLAVQNRERSRSPIPPWENDEIAEDPAWTCHGAPFPVSWDFPLVFEIAVCACSPCIFDSCSFWRTHRVLTSFLDAFQAASFLQSLVGRSLHFYNMPALNISRSQVYHV